MSMNLNLAGKVALVTGGSRGIGAAICRALAAEGVRVGVNYSASAEQAAAVVSSIGANAVALNGNLEHPDEIPALFDVLERVFGPADILVNNAARCPGGPLAGYTVEEWERTFRVNVTAAFAATQEHVRRLRARGAKGKVVNIASQAAYLGSTSGHLPYDASKGALVSMTHAVARETAREGINVNAVAPGMVMTEMVAKVWEAKKEHYLARIPMGRIAQPEEIADAVVFLASDASSYLTGAVLDLTGGLLMH